MSYSVSAPEADAARQAILDLWSRNLPGAADARYDWLYATERATSLWLRAADGGVVGSTGVMHREFLADGTRWPGAQAVDLNVDKAHRSIGPALGLQRAVIGLVNAGALRLVYGFPNALSEPVLRRVGYRELGPLARWVRPLSTRMIFRRVRPLQWCAGGLALVGDRLLRCVQRETFHRRRRGTRTELVDTFDARFDRLWQRAARQLPIAGERSAAFLQWRFHGRPGVQHQTFCLLNAERELSGYIVFRREEATIHLADLLFADAAALDDLLAAFLRHVRGSDADVASCTYLGSRLVTDALRRYGFWPRACDWRALVYFGPQTAPEEWTRLLVPDRWHFTRADFDTND